MHTHLGAHDRTHPTAGAWRSRAVSFIATVALLLGGAVAGRAQPTYVAVDLGTLGGTSLDSSVAMDINNRGDIVGFSTINGQTHAFLWTQSGGMQDLGTLGGAESRANAINDSGQVVGSAQNAAGVQRAFLWTASGGMVEIGPENTPSSATDINNAGQVVGSYQDRYPGIFPNCCYPFTRAFLWAANTWSMLTVNVGAPNPPQLHMPTGINEAGQISCYWMTPVSTGPYPCIGSQRPEGRSSNSFGRANGINNLGQVVGHSDGFPVIWSAADPSQPPTIIGAPGAPNAEPSGINDSGQVVGRDNGRGFVWSASAGSADLGPVVLPTALGALRINNGGAVVGTRLVGGRERATRWQLAGGPVTSVTLTTDREAPQPAGTRIVLTGTATGGVAPVSYRFWLQPWATGVWQVLQDWSTTNTVPWTPAAQGGYNLAVEARGAGGSSGEAQSAIGYAISSGSGGGGGGGGGGGRMTGITLSTNPTDPQPRGTTIVLSGTGAGGTAPYSYRFWVQPWNGDWQVIQEWSPTATASWTPTVAGGYNIAVEGRSSGANSAEVSTSNTYVITSSGGGGGGGGGGGRMTDVALAANAFWPQPLGTTVTWTATGQGGTAPYSFRFWVQPWDGAWQVVRDWSTSASFVWRPTAAGGYNVAVEARSAGATAKEVQKAEVFVIAAP